MSKSWTDIWPQVEGILKEYYAFSLTQQEALQAVSKLRGMPTSWAALRRARLRVNEVTEPVQNYTESRIEQTTLKLPRHVVKGGKPTTYLQPVDGETWLYVSDVHFGIQDTEALKKMLVCVQDNILKLPYKAKAPFKVILGGDIFDCYSLSKYDKTPYPKRECYSIEDEAKSALWFWSSLRDLHPEAVYYLPGNHEDRIWAVESKNIGLVNTLSIQGLFNVPEYVNILPRFGRIVANSLVVEHGHKIPGTLSTNGEAKVLRDHPYQITVYGHTHKFGVKHHTIHLPSGESKVYSAYSIGHMSIAEHHVDYSPDSNWQQGFALIKFVEINGVLEPFVQPAMFKGKDLVFNGEKY
jgi:UDP-2,3-diacylglucosamine pyrophosphatase LpxH